MIHLSTKWERRSQITTLRPIRLLHTHGYQFSLSVLLSQSVLYDCRVITSSTWYQICDRCFDRRTQIISDRSIFSIIINNLWQKVIGKAHVVPKMHLDKIRRVELNVLPWNSLFPFIFSTKIVRIFWQVLFSSINNLRFSVVRETEKFFPGIFTHFILI